jgi:hypothetical protein
LPLSVVVVVVELDVIGAGAGSGAGCCTTTCAGGGSLETIGAGEVFSTVLWYEHAEKNPHTAIAAGTIANRLKRMIFRTSKSAEYVVAATSSSRW